MDKNEPMRVAQIVGKLWAGGVEAVVFNYYRQIDKSKVQFDFFYDADSTVEPPQSLIEMGARFYRIPPYQKLLQYIIVLKKYFKENQYKVVHSHINTLSVFPLFVAWTEKIPVRIAHNHSVPGGKEVGRNILKSLLKIFSKVFSTDYFACSEKAGRWLFGNKEYDRGKVLVVNNAVDFNRFQLCGERVEEYRVKYKIKDKFVVGHIGRFTYAKNHSFLFKVFVEILKRREDAVLLLVGDGELRDEINREIITNNIENRVILAGKVMDTENYYGLIDVMVIPSLYEGLSLTTIESQVAGIPVVASEAIPEEAVISNVCKRLSLENTPKDWANEIMNIVTISAQLNENSKKYDIKRSSDILTTWYYSRLEK